jgi:hypothetical protein
VAIIWDAATRTHTIRRLGKESGFLPAQEVERFEASTNTVIEADSKSRMEPMLLGGELFFLHILNEDWRTAQGGQPLRYSILRGPPGHVPERNWWETIPNPAE